VSETPGVYNVGGDRPERSQTSIQKLDTKLDLLIEQLGRLTEVLTTGLADFNARLDRIADVAERQALTIERQSVAIERLVLILEKQVTNSP
jgi:methyl-accepting chemotaxis protein